MKDVISLKLNSIQIKTHATKILLVSNEYDSRLLVHVLHLFIEVMIASIEIHFFFQFLFVLNWQFKNKFISDQFFHMKKIEIF